jgi:hypothetical protein
VKRPEPEGNAAAGVYLHVPVPSGNQCLPRRAARSGPASYRQLDVVRAETHAVVTVESRASRAAGREQQSDGAARERVHGEIIAAVAVHAREHVAAPVVGALAYFRDQVRDCPRIRTSDRKRRSRVRILGQRDTLAHEIPLLTRLARSVQCARPRLQIAAVESGVER